MKKLFLVLVVICLMVSQVSAVTVPNKISGNTVSFSSVNFSLNRGPTIVTFNSVTKHVKLTNLSTTADCYVDLRCIASNGQRGYANINTWTVLLPAVGKQSPNTVDFDFATQNLGFFSNTIDVSTNGGVSGSNQQVTYTVTGEDQEL